MYLDRAAWVQGRVFCTLGAQNPPPRASRRAKKSENTRKRYETGRRYLKQKGPSHFAALQHLPTAKSDTADSWRTFGWMWREVTRGYTTLTRELGTELRRF